ncbi:hypothetical protein JPSP53_14860 [Staphylococcus pseudintermedius]
MINGAIEIIINRRMTPKMVNPDENLIDNNIAKKIAIKEISKSPIIFSKSL